MPSETETVISKEVKTASLLDGLSNLATGLGSAKDKSSHNVWTHSGRNADHPTLSARFREDWLSQKICTILPQDMTREWREFESPLATEADEHFEVSDKVREAYKWARLYGTSFIVLDIADGRSLDKPVNWARLKPGCLRSMTVVDRTRIVATGDIDQTPMSPTFGMPDLYQFVNTNSPVHKSRLIRFEGTELPIYERQRNLWYSDSVLIPLTKQIDNFHVASAAAAQMVQEANVDVISIKGLQNILTDSNATSAMLNRFLEWNQIKSSFGVSILDQNEIYEKKTIQLSGVKDLIWEYLKIVAASVGIPATRFLSASPDGMNATGESDLINYVEMLMGMQKAIFNPRVRVIDKLMAAHFGLDEELFKFKWSCIFPESSAQKAERLVNLSEAHKNWADAGIVSRESILKKLIDEGHFPPDATVGDNPNPPKPVGGANASK